MLEYQVSTEGCWLFNNGKYCPRAAKSPGCPYVHDMDARKDAIEKKRMKDLKKKDMKLAASRAKLQQQYNNNLASKVSNVNKAKQIVKSTNIAQINSKIEAIINQTNTDIQQCSTAENLNSGMIDSMISKINDAKLGLIKVTPFETVYRLSWATVIYSKPVTEVAYKHSNIPQVYHKVCKYFKAGYCKKGNRCYFSHDQSGPFVAPKPTPAENAPVTVEQPQAVVTYATTASKGIVVPKILPSKVEQSQALVATPTLSASDQDLINFNKRSWDTYDTLGCWAHDNLRLTTSVQFLAPYIRAGKIPKSALFGNGGEKASDKAVFHNFGLLPAELRIQIWKYAFKAYNGEARVVWKWDDYHAGHYYHSRLESKNPPPPFIHVNKECRSLAARHFALTFGTMQAGPETWFNYEQDELFLNTAFAGQILPMVKLFIDRERNHVQRLEVPLRDFVHNKKDFIDAVCRFTDLKQLYLAVADTREDMHWAYDPHMEKKVTRAIEALWIRRHKLAPTPVPVPMVKVRRMDGIKAKFYGIDGITWGGNVSGDVWNDS